ncbi:MAG TPA: 2-dehydropantoate 2-reductase [Aeromonadales bacterium]|nr:2-dehydropantoate 2-reductase [Aeromonadales bacterium]
MSRKLRILVVGAGGIGCYYGIRLLQQGHDVHFVARGAHLEAIQNKGLVMEHAECSFSGAVNACSFDEIITDEKPSDFDFIFLTTKATSTQSIAETLSEWFKASKSKTAVISLQNGVDNEVILSGLLGKDIIIGGLAIRIGGHIIRPGVIEAKGVAEIKMGVWPNEDSGVDNRFKTLLPQWVQIMNEAGIPTVVVENIQYELWRKLAINNGVNPLSVLTGMDTFELSNHKSLGVFVYKMMQETAVAAQADGITLTENDIEEMYQLICHFDPIKTSMLVDWEKQRTLEIDAIPGVVIQRAHKIQQEVPVTSLVYALIQQKIESRLKKKSVDIPA